MRAALASPACPGAPAVVRTLATPCGAQFISVPARLRPRVPQPLASAERVCVLQQMPGFPRPHIGVRDVHRAQQGGGWTAGGPVQDRLGVGIRGLRCRGWSSGPYPDPGNPKASWCGPFLGTLLAPSPAHPLLPPKVHSGQPAGPGPNRHHVSLKKDGGSKLTRAPPAQTLHQEDKA